MEISNELRQQLLDEIAGIIDIPDGAISVSDLTNHYKEKGQELSYSTAGRILRRKWRNGELDRAWDGRQYKYWRKDG